MQTPTIWRTTHEINRNVSESVHRGTGFPIINTDFVGRRVLNTPSIAYGILRGTSEAFAHSQKNGLEWWEVDNGYFKRGHFNGYYRVSRNGLCATYDDTKTQQLTDDRFKVLNITIKDWCNPSDGFILVCPPTPAIEQFYGMEQDGWLKSTLAYLALYSERAVKVRPKDVNSIPLSDDLRGAYCVLTFNSNVAVDALASGIPAITSPVHTIFGWNGLKVEDVATKDIRIGDRQRLFNFLAHCQFTLGELEQKRTWKDIFHFQDCGLNITYFHEVKSA